MTNTTTYETSQLAEEARSDAQVLAHPHEEVMDNEAGLRVALQLDRGALSQLHNDSAQVTFSAGYVAVCSCGWLSNLWPTASTEQRTGDAAAATISGHDAAREAAYSAWERHKRESQPSDAAHQAIGARECQFLAAAWLSEGTRCPGAMGTYGTCLIQGNPPRLVRLVTSVPGGWPEGVKDDVLWLWWTDEQGEEQSASLH